MSGSSEELAGVASSSGVILALAVFMGGVVGAVGRTALSLAAGLSPWMTLVENTLGCLLLGALYGALRRLRAPDWLVAGLGAGALGSFTSMSAYVADTWALVGGSGLSGGVYLVLTLVLGVGAAHVGMGAGGRWAKGRSGEVQP